MRCTNTNRSWLGRTTEVVGIVACALGIVACSGQEPSSGGTAPKATSSGIPAAPPRALGPGAAQLEAPVKEPPPIDDGEEPFVPFPGPADDGTGHPPQNSLPL